MKLDSNPCYECPDRHYKCHSDCPKYIEAKRKHEATRKKAEEEGIYLGYISMIAQQKRERFRKRRK